MANCKKITKDGAPIVVDAAIRDGNGKKIDQEYAKQTGYFQGMRVGQADALTAGLNYNEKVLINNIRPSGLGSDIATGLSKIKSIHGSTMIYSQLMKKRTGMTTWTQDGITFEYSGDHTLHIYGTSTAEVNIAIYADILIVAGRTYYINYNCNKDLTNHISSSASDWYIWDRWASGFNGNGFWHNKNKTNFCSGIIIKNNKTVDIIFSEPLFIDLSMLFTSTKRIPVGATLESILNDFYYEGNTNHMMQHSKPSAYECIGYNLYETNLDYGMISTDDGTTISKTGTSSYAYSVNYMRCLPSTGYHHEVKTIGGPAVYSGGTNFYIYEYDINKNFIKATTNIRHGVGQFTTTNRTYYLRFVVRYNTNIIQQVANIRWCVHFQYSGSKSGYEDYTKYTTTLPGIELKGIPGGEADELAPNGILTTKIKMLDLSQLSWTFVSNGNASYFESNALGNIMRDFVKPTTIGDVANLICDIYSVEETIYPNDYTSLTENMSIRVPLLEQLKLHIIDHSLDSEADPVAALQTKLANAHIYYATTNPTVEQTEYTYNETPFVDDWGTQEIKQETLSYPNAPLLDIEYAINLQSYLQRLYLNTNGDGSYLKNEIDKRAYTYTTLGDGLAHLPKSVVNKMAINGGGIINGMFNAGGGIYLKSAVLSLRREGDSASIYAVAIGRNSSNEAVVYASLWSCDKNDDTGVISESNSYAMQYRSFSGIPLPPADASTSTYVLKLVNGTWTYVKEV